jgi:hypothetical protein
MIDLALHIVCRADKREMPQGDANRRKLAYPTGDRRGTMHPDIIFSS